MAASSFKVVLAVPEFTGRRAGSENLGISYIEASLNTLSFVDTLTINRNCTLKTTEIAEIVRYEKPNLLGLSISTYELLNSLRDLLQLLSSDADCPIVVGGHYATFVAPDVMNEFSDIDICVIGEGEETILDLVARLSSGAVINDVPGILYRKDDQLFATSHRTKVRDLDSLAFPKREPGLPVYSLAGSRGCYTTCSFCSVPQFFKLLPGRNFRMRSVENISNEVGILKGLGARAVSFVDDVFLLPGRRGLERAKEIADVMAYYKIKWAFGCRTPELTEEILAYCAARGLCNVGLGLESGSDHVLERLSKRANLAASERSIALCRKYEVSIQPYFIMFEPDMSLDDLRSNIVFLSRFGLLWPSFATNELDPYPGTPAYQELEGSGRLMKIDGRIVPKYIDEKLAAVKCEIQDRLSEMISEEYTLRRRQFESELSGDRQERDRMEAELWKLSDRTQAAMMLCIRKFDDLAIA